MSCQVYIMKKIAVVDDDQPILEVVSLILQDEGFEVVPYSDGEALIRDLGKKEFHLVLLDYRLPKKNGVEIAKEVKIKAKNKNTPVIIISANHNMEHIKKNESVDDFIPKPFELSHLVKTIHHYI